MTNKKTLRSKSIAAFFWEFTGNIGLQLINFIVSILLARLLMPEDFGLLAMVNIIFIFSNLFLDAGLGAALIQRKRVLDVHYSSVFYFNVVVGVVLTLITYFSAGLIGGFYEQPKVVPLIEVMSVTFIVSSLTVIQNIKFKKELDFKKRAIVRFFSTILSGSAGVLLALNGFGVWSLVLQLLVNRTFFLVMVWFQSDWRPSFLFSWKALKQLWGFGSNIFFNDVLAVIFNKADVLIIGKLFPIATLGYYQRARSLESLIMDFTTSSLMQVLFPVFSSIQNELSRLRTIVFKAMNLLSMLVFFVIGLFYLSAEEIILLLFTEKWIAVVPYFKILLLSSYIGPFSSLFVNIILGRGESKIHLKLSMIKKIPQSLNLILGFQFGIEGFLYGLVISNSISFMLNIYYAKHILEVASWWFLKPVLAFLSLTIVAVTLEASIFQFLTINSNLVSLVLKSAFFFVLFFGTSFLFKMTGLNMLLEEVKLIKK